MLYRYSGFRAKGTLKHLVCILRVTSQRTCSTQGEKFISTERTELSSVSEETFPSTINVFRGGEDMSDPCAGLDFNNMTNEKIDEPINELQGSYFEDERFPLSSEPLDKGR